MSIFFQGQNWGEFAPAYDTLINQALMLVGREEEYSASGEGDDTGGEGKRRAYRTIMAQALQMVFLRSSILWARHPLVMTQAKKLEDGYGYLPPDFVGMYQPPFDGRVRTGVLTPISLKYTDSGQPICLLSEATTEYIRMPREILRLHPCVLEAVKLQFLYDCLGRDPGFQSNTPFIEERWRRAFHNLDSEVSKIKARNRPRRSFRAPF